MGFNTLSIVTGGHMHVDRLLNGVDVSASSVGYVRRGSVGHFGAHALKSNPQCTGG